MADKEIILYRVGYKKRPDNGLIMLVSRAIEKRVNIILLDSLDVGLREVRNDSLKNMGIGRSPHEAIELMFNGYKFMIELYSNNIKEYKKSIRELKQMRKNYR